MAYFTVHDGLRRETTSTATSVASPSTPIVTIYGSQQLSAPPPKPTAAEEEEDQTEEIESYPGIVENENDLELQVELEELFRETTEEGDKT